MGVSIASSDSVLTTATGHWAADKESVEDFKKTFFEVWIIKCGFIADMGGTEMNPAEFVPFRVTAKQVHYLVTKSHISSPFLVKISPRMQLPKLLISIDERPKETTRC